MNGLKIQYKTIYLHILYPFNLKYSEPGGCYLLLTPASPGLPRDVDSVQLRPRVGDHVISHVGELVTSRVFYSKTLL